MVSRLFLLGLLGWILGNWSPMRVLAQEPTYTASPSATPTVLVQAGVMCQSLRIVSGNNQFVPSTVEFEATAGEGASPAFRYHYGDGVVEDNGSRISHRYAQAGEYQAYVEVQNAAGDWVTSEGCEKSVTVRAVPLVPHRSECSAVEVLEGAASGAPATVSFQVTGEDNKGPLQGYLLAFGDGTELEQAGENAFVHTYVEPGTYEVKGQVRNSEGNLVGGSGCSRQVRVASMTVMEKQPETGVPMWMLVTATMLLVVGLLGRGYAYRMLEEKV